MILQLKFVLFFLSSRLRYWMLTCGRSIPRMINECEWKDITAVFFWVSLKKLNYRCIVVISGAPVGAKGAPRAELHTHRKWEIRQAKKIWWSPPRPYVRTYIRTYVRTYVRTDQAWDEFIFVLEFGVLLTQKVTQKHFFGLLRVNFNVIETCKNTLLLQRFFFSCFLMIWTFHFNLNEAVV